MAGDMGTSMCSDGSRVRISALNSLTEQTTEAINCLVGQERARNRHYYQMCSKGLFPLKKGHESLCEDKLHTFC